LATVEDRTKELAEEPKNPRTMADSETIDFDEREDDDVDWGRITEINDPSPY
jgi:hypothetical protein